MDAHNRAYQELPYICGMILSAHTSSYLGQYKPVGNQITILKLLVFTDENTIRPKKYYK